MRPRQPRLWVAQANGNSFSKFADALEKAVTHIQREPGTGSARYAHELDIPGLRFWLMGRFPYGLFYLEHEDHLLLVRLVHMSRDIPASLRT